MTTEDISRESYKILQNMHMAMSEVQRRMGTDYSMKELYGRPLEYNEGDPCFPLDLYIEDNLENLYSGSE